MTIKKKRAASELPRAGPAALAKRVDSRRSSIQSELQQNLRKQKRASRLPNAPPSISNVPKRLALPSASILWRFGRYCTRSTCQLSKSAEMRTRHVGAWAWGR